MKALAVYMPVVSGSEKENLKRIISVLKKNFDLKVRHRSRLESLNAEISKKEFDMIFSIGGDGTFLKVARHVNNSTPIMSINLNPEGKEGFYTVANAKNLEKRIRMLKEKKHRIVKLMRLEALVNGKKIPEVALNEFFVGNEMAFLSSKYKIKYKGKTELHKSSGVIVATASGSNSWFKSAGGKPFPISSSKFAFTIREPYCGNTIKCNLKTGFLSPGETLELESLMKQGIVALDSAIHYHFDEGDKIRIRASKKQVNWVGF